MASAALTFGSVGDIIALCSVIQQGAEALSNSHGSKTQYQSIKREAWNLSRALLSVQSLLEQYPDLQRRGDLEKILADCHECLVRFLKRIEVYDCLDLSDDKQSAVQDLKLAFTKLRWPAQQVFLARTMLRRKPESTDRAEELRCVSGGAADTHFVHRCDIEQQRNPIFGPHSSIADGVAAGPRAEALAGPD